MAGRLHALGERGLGRPSHLQKNGNVATDIPLLQPDRAMGTEQRLQVPGSTCATPRPTGAPATLSRRAPFFSFAAHLAVQCGTSETGQHAQPSQVASGRTLPAFKWEGPRVIPSRSLRRACARTMMTRAAATTTGGARSAQDASRATSLTATRATARRPHAHPHHFPRAAAVESRPGAELAHNRLQMRGSRAPPAHRADASGA